MNKKSGSYDSTKAVLGFTVVLVGFGIFTLFDSYKDNILDLGMYKPFMALTIVGMGLLVGLVYLAGQTQTSKKKRK